MCGRVRGLLSAGAATILLVACNGRQSPGADELARFGNDTLSGADLTVALLDMPRTEQVEYLTPAGKRALVDILIDRKLAAREAIRLGLQVSPPADAGPAGNSAASERALEAAWLARRLAGSEPIADAGLREFYARHRTEFARPRRIRVERISFATHAEASAARAILQPGTTFAAYRDARPGQSIEVDALWLQPRDKPSELERIALALQAGQLSEPLQIATGFCLLRIAEDQPAGVPPFESIRAQVAARATQHRREAQLQEIRSELRAGQEISISADAIERYRCTACGEP